MGAMGVGYGSKGPGRCWPGCFSQPEDSNTKREGSFHFRRRQGAYHSTNKDGETYLEFLESGINLKVIPRISEDEYITIQVRPEVSTFIWRGENQHPQIRTREAETEVRVKNGQPIIIGGLLQEQENELITKIPIISELPILGRLFRWQETKTLQTEMTIFLIPHIVSDDEGVMNQSFFTPAQ